MTPETPDRPFFSGTYERTLDAKNRVAVPAAWVSGEDVEFFVVPHPVDGQLMVMPQAELRATEQQIKDHALAHAPAYAHPRRVWFVREMPLSGTNKIERKTTLQMALDRLAVEGPLA